MRVKSKDYGRQYAALRPDLMQRIAEAMEDDNPILGRSVAAFEQALAAFHGIPHAVGVGSGTDALILMFRALGLEGREVLTSSHTFSGVVSAMLQAGVRPRFVEPSPRTGQVTAATYDDAGRADTAAVLAVHLHGHPCELDQLTSLCARRGWRLLEDAAQAHGARWMGRPVGSFGEATALSFHPSKNLGAFGDGGAVLCKDGDVATRLRRLRNLGKEGKAVFREVGPNSKLDTLQAVILKLKLERLPEWLRRRRQLAARYFAGLGHLPGLRLPPQHPDADPAWHLFVVGHEQRDALRQWLAERGVHTGMHYPVAAADQPAWAHHFADHPTPVARRLAQTGLTLPLSHEHQDAEIDHVVQCVRAFITRATP